MRMNRFVVVAVALAAVNSSYGDFVETEIPTWRGDLGSSYYGWEYFTQAIDAPNMNDSGSSGGMLFNFADGAFITSTGNIYNQSSGLNIHVYGYDAVEQAVLNIASQGTEFDYAGVTLWVGDGVNGMMFLADDWSVNHYEPIEGFGAIVNTSFTWDLSSYSGTVTEWAFFFQGTAPHNVLDAVTVDIFADAVPGAGGLFAFGLLGFRTSRR